MNLIGVDLGGTKILGVLSNERGEIQARLREPTDAYEGMTPVISRMIEIIRELTPPEGIDGIAVGVPGPVDPVRGIIYGPPNLPGWETVPLRQLLLHGLDLDGRTPLVLVNDANAAALGEYTFGAGCEQVHGKKIHHLVYMTISTGVGGGVIADGKLFLGSTGMAAELGHMVVDLHGPRCNCGNFGCLEIMASGTALAREAATVVASRRDTVLTEVSKRNTIKITAPMVVEAAHGGDAVALELMEREGLLVGVGVVNCIHAFNPQLVVLGGGVTHAGDLLFKPVRATVEARIMHAYRGTYEIVPAALGDDVGALGAVAAALEATKADAA